MGARCGAGRCVAVADARRPYGTDRWGPSATALNTAIGKHVPFWQNSLDLAVLTSPKEDSLTGLVDLLGRRKIEQIVQTEFTPTTSVQGAWQEAVAQSSARLSIATLGDVITFDKEPGLALRVLYPPAGGTTGEAPIVLRLEYNGTSVLLASNMSEQDETRLLALSTGDELKSDVLIVGRHGSDGATALRRYGATALRRPASSPPSNHGWPSSQ